jgi:hypothetical protein
MSSAEDGKLLIILAAEFSPRQQTPDILQLRLLVIQDSVCYRNSWQEIIGSKKQASKQGGLFSGAGKYSRRPYLMKRLIVVKSLTIVNKILHTGCETVS